MNGMNYYLGGQGSEGQSGPGAVGAVGAGVPGVGVGLGGSLGSHSHSHATSQQQQQQQVQQQQYLMQQHYAAYQAQAHAQANANANQAYQPTTNQERINDVTMTIEVRPPDPTHETPLRTLSFFFRLFGNKKSSFLLPFLSLLARAREREREREKEREEEDTSSGWPASDLTLFFFFSSSVPSLFFRFLFFSFPHCCRTQTLLDLDTLGTRPRDAFKGRSSSSL